MEKIINTNDEFSLPKKVAFFEKVSHKQFKEDYINCFNLDETAQVSHKVMINTIYESLQLPKRSTSRSAGYDFFAPLGFKLSSGETIKIPTGVRASMDDNWCLKIYPRSSLGCKYKLQLDNTVGIIDSDYYFSDNEGHIMLGLTNNGEKDITIRMGDKLVQGIFCEYGITINDNVTETRNGGFGSTGR